MNRQNATMLAEMEVITEFNKLKTETVENLKIYLELNNYSIDVKEVTGDDNLSIGYKLTVDDITANGRFIISNEPKEKAYVISRSINSGLKEQRLYYNLIGYNLQTKLKIDFNLDILKEALNSQKR